MDLDDMFGAFDPNAQAASGGATDAQKSQEQPNTMASRKRKRSPEKSGEANGNNRSADPKTLKPVSTKKRARRNENEAEEERK